MALKERPILLQKRDGIGYITFNRPEVLNAFRPSDYILFDDLVNECDRDDNLRAIIITGKGRAWSVGDDVNVAIPGPKQDELVKRDPGMKLIFERKFLDVRLSGYQIPTQKTCMTLLNSGKVSIAAVNGVCYISEYLYAMDFVIAADIATFGQGDVKIGISPIGSSTQLAPRVLGRRRATELILLAELISAQEAYRLGLVNRVVPLPELLQEAEALAKQVMSYSPSAIKLTKMLMTKAQDLPLKDGLELEQLYSEISLTSGYYESYAKRFIAGKKGKGKSKSNPRKSG